jgi:hypothetical protein
MAFPRRSVGFILVPFAGEAGRGGESYKKKPRCSAPGNASSSPVRSWYAQCRLRHNGGGARRLAWIKYETARVPHVPSASLPPAYCRKRSQPKCWACFKHPCGPGFNLSVARFGASDCTFLRGACCTSDKLAGVLAKGRSLKRRDLFTIHPQQGGLVRADHLFRGSPFSGSLLRHGTPLPCPCYFLTPWIEGRS